MRRDTVGVYISSVGSLCLLVIENGSFSDHPKVVFFALANHKKEILE